MATIELSGYNAAASSVLTTELNSLATGNTALTGAIDNSSDHAIWDDLELVVTYGTAPAANAVVEIYIVPSADGTNYADGTTGTPGTVPSPNMLVWTFLLRNVTSAQRLVTPPQTIKLPPGLFKYLLRNQAGQTMAASGNTLKRRPYEMQSV